MEFSYEAHTRSGVPKKGTIEADSKEDASEKLRAKDWFILSIVPADEKHKMVLVHGKVPEEQDDDDEILDIDAQASPENAFTSDYADRDRVDGEGAVGAGKRQTDPHGHNDGDREPFGDEVTLGSIRQAMRVAGISWDPEANEWRFRRISFDNSGEQVTRWMPAIKWMAHRLEDARAAHQLSQIIKSATERAANASLTTEGKKDGNE